MITEDFMNALADMPGQTLPVYSLQFPEDVLNCVALFPVSVGAGAVVGVVPGKYAETTGVVGYIDYPGIQIQVRYTDPYNAYKLAEDIRVWLEDHLPTGYLRCDAARSMPDDLTSDGDLNILGGPCYRFAADFACMKVR